jgi:site-specific recombinase XerD
LREAKAHELTNGDFIEWKEALIKSGLSTGTIKKNLNMMKTVFGFAALNAKITVDPTLGVVYQAKRDPRKKRLGYTKTRGRSCSLRGAKRSHIYGGHRGSAR